MVERASDNAVFRATTNCDPATLGSAGAGYEPAIAWLESLVETMAAAWRRGEPLTALELFGRYPELTGEAALRLIYEEVCLKREAGQPLETHEVLARYPRWRSELEMLLDCDRFLRPPPEPLFPNVGDRLGGFQLVGELGRGAAGRTFLASEPSLADRNVVLKLMPHDQHEHLSLARLQHTHIVPLYSAHLFAERGLRALCMPYLGGASLSAVLDALENTPLERRTGRSLLQVIDQTPFQALSPTVSQGPFRHFLERATYVQAICLLGACLADALQYAHDHSLVHMDVKPSNVLVSSEGQPMLLDFHLAQRPAQAGATGLNRVGGTPGWMSPEQEAAMRAMSEGRPIEESIDARSDIYSLGLLLRQALKQNSSYSVPGSNDRAWHPHTTVGLADIVTKCLHPKPPARYQTAAELADDLRRHLNDLPLRGVANRSPVECYRKWRRRRPYGLARGAAWIATVAACLIALAFGSVIRGHRIGEIRNALEDGRRLRVVRRYPDALLALGRGVQVAERTLGAGDQLYEMRQELQLALRGKKAEELHELADMVRFQYGVDPPPTDEMRTVAARLRAIWNERDLVTSSHNGSLDPDQERSIRTDLLDLAIVWSDLHVRLAPPAARAGARQEALGVLDEASASFGPSAALDRERRLQARALGLPEPPAAPAAPPQTAWEHYDLGRSYLRSGQLPAASEEFERALELRPQDFWPNFYKGLCALRLGRAEEAAGLFRACIVLAPSVAECYYNRGLAYEAMERHDKAAADFRKASELDPSISSSTPGRQSPRGARDRDAQGVQGKAGPIPPHALRAPANQSELEPSVGTHFPSETADRLAERSQLTPSEPAQHGNGPVVAHEPIAGEQAAPGHEAPICQPVPANIEHDDAPAGNSGHFRDESVEGGPIEMMRELHCRYDVDAAIVERETKRVGAHGVQSRQVRETRCGGFAVEGDDKGRQSAFAQTSANSAWDIAAAGADVQDGKLGPARPFLREKLLHFARATRKVAEQAVHTAEHAIGVGHFPLR
jgi:serine/threonine protein kinase/tetratricopeptide (TPR) repeat protein